MGFRRMSTAWRTQGPQGSQGLGDSVRAFRWKDDGCMRAESGIGCGASYTLILLTVSILKLRGG